MAYKTGYLDDHGHPHIKIRVWGLSEQFGQEFQAMIDTGFTGFLMLPLVQALPLGLTLFGTTTYTLADGSQSPKLLAHGSIDHEGEVTSGLIVLEANASSGPLVGMEFLRSSKKLLVLGRNAVMLLDEMPIQEPASTPDDTDQSPEANPPVDSN